MSTTQFLFLGSLLKAALSGRQERETFNGGLPCLPHLPALNVRIVTVLAVLKWLRRNSANLKFWWEFLGTGFLFQCIKQGNHIQNERSHRAAELYKLTPFLSVELKIGVSKGTNVMVQMWRVLIKGSCTEGSVPSLWSSPCEVVESWQLWSNAYLTTVSQGID